MRVKKVQNLQKFFWIILIVFGVQFFFTEKTLAQDVNFGQRILPVSFVYLNQGNIKSVWSNVTQADDFYVVKFFNEKNEEISPNKKLFANYFSKKEEVVVDAYLTKCVQFVERENLIEEIRTIV